MMKQEDRQLENVSYNPPATVQLPPWRRACFSCGVVTGLQLNPYSAEFCLPDDRRGEKLNKCPPKDAKFPQNPIHEKNTCLTPVSFTHL